MARMEMASNLKKLAADFFNKSSIKSVKTDFILFQFLTHRSLCGLEAIHV